MLAASMPVSVPWQEFDVGGMFFWGISFTIFDYLFVLSLADCGLLSISVFINIFKWKVVFNLDHSSKIFGLKFSELYLKLELCFFIFNPYLRA